MKTAYCFDLDGTLTTTEILPCIAAELGISEEIATLTRLTMEGMISFEESLRLRAAILGQVPVERVHAVIEDIPLDPTVLGFIRSRSEQCFVITGNLDIWVADLIRRIGCRGFCSQASIANGRLRVDKVLDKGQAAHQARDAGFEAVVAIGDGSNDVPMFRVADIAVAYGGTHSPTAAAIAESDYVVHDGRALCSLLSSL